MSEFDDITSSSSESLENIQRLDTPDYPVTPPHEKNDDGNDADGEEEVDEVSVILVSVESPFNAYLPWKLLRNIQYAIQANKHAAYLGDVTWTPHICNTQFVKWGFNSYIGDSIGQLANRLTRNRVEKYAIGREQTLINTNAVRASHVNKIVCYTDFGVSSGMRSAIDIGEKNGVEVEYRKLPKDMMSEVFGQSFKSTFIPILIMLAKYGLLSYGFYRLMIVNNSPTARVLTRVKNSFVMSNLAQRLRGLFGKIK